MAAIYDSYHGVDNPWQNNIIYGGDIIMQRPVGTVNNIGLLVEATSLMVVRL